MNTYIKYTIVFAVIFLLFNGNILPQISKTDYFMGTSITRNYLNPALTPEQGYLVVPVIPTVGVSLQTNSLNLDNLTFKKGGKRVTFLHQDVSTQEFLKNIKSNNNISVDGNTKLFALGFYKGDNFWNIDLGVRVHADVNIPKSAFELFKVGFDNDQPTAYNLKDIRANIFSFAEIGVSHSRRFLNDKLTAGARVKALVGMGHANLQAKTLEIEASEKQWKALSHVTLKGATFGVEPTYDSEDGYLDGFDFDWNGIPGWGAGLDLGVVYDVSDILPILEGLKVSAALNDIGFISWNKSNTLAMSSAESEVIINLDDYNIANGSSLEAVLEDALERLRDAVDLQETPEDVSGYTTGLRTTLNIGAEYDILEEKLSVGALVSNYFGNNRTQSELTFSGNYRPCSWFATALSYSALGSRFNTFGLSMHFIPKRGVNLFLSSDYVIAHVSPQFLPTTSKAVNLQFGISVPLGSRH